MLSHDTKIATFNSSKILHGPVSNFFFITSQRCSIEFRSGLCDGHGLTDILFISNQDLVLLALWHGAPSCWKIKSLPHSFFPSFSRVRQISLTYADASSRPLTTLRLPTPLAAMHPHTWIFPPPFIAVGTIQSRWYRSPTLLLKTVLLPGISSKIDSSENNIVAHCSDVQSFLSRHHSSLFCLWACVLRGFLTATQPFNPNPRSCLLIVLEHTWVPVASFNFKFNNFRFNKWIVPMWYTCEIPIRRTLGMRDF